MQGCQPQFLPQATLCCSSASELGSQHPVSPTWKQKKTRQESECLWHDRKQEPVHL